MSKKLMRKKLAMMLANLKKKRPFYTEVEYLENTSGTYAESGTGASENVGSYINTGINPKPNGIVKIGLSLNTGGSNPYQCLFGGYDNNTKNFGVVIQNNTTYFLDGNQTSSSDTWTRDLYYEIEFNASQKKLIKNGVSTTYSVNGLSADSNLSIYLFTDNSVGGGMDVYNTTYTLKGKIYYFRYYEGDTLVCDMIPVLDWDMAPCMYDKVSGQLFYNQGTGDFSYGREIHYVDYLESTGTQYIDTGYIPSNTTGVQVKHTICANNNKDNILFGCRENSGDTRFWEDVDWTNSDTIGWGFNTYSGTSSGYRYPLTTDMVGQTITASLNFMNDRACKINGVSYDPNPQTTTLTTITRPIYLFGANNQGSFGYANACKMFTAQISNGQTLVRDYLPAIDENGVSFLFDNVTHTIYDNAGTGAFKYPATELEYIESNGNQYIDTGVVLSSTDKVEASVEYTGTPTQGSSYAFGTFGSNKNFGINCTLKSTPKSWYGVWYNQGTLTSSTIFSDLNTRYDIQISSNGMYINDNLLTTVSGTFTGSVSAYLFWAHGTSQPKSLMKLYSCKMWKNGVLTRDYIPSIKDGVIGLFDKVNDVFYDNDGTGTFTGGPVKEDEYE